MDRNFEVWCYNLVTDLGKCLDFDGNVVLLLSSVDHLSIEPESPGEAQLIIFNCFLGAAD